MYYADDIIKRMRHAHYLAVFGAGIMAEAVVYCMSKKPYQLQIQCCLVSKLDGNPKHVLGVSVIDFSEAEKCLPREAIVLVASVGGSLENMKNSLYQHGYYHLILLTYEGDLWSLLRGNLYLEYRRSLNRSYLVLEEELKRSGEVGSADLKGDLKSCSFCIYVVESDRDKNICENRHYSTWEVSIQAGAALADRQICKIRDDTGENISYKNRQYCELTALYWIWKHDRSDYVGLEHYRRRFELSEEMQKKLAGSDIDVVFTIPILDLPDVRSVYRRDHVGKDWDIMTEAVRTLTPDYMESVMELESGQFYYAYNMFIMRRTVLEAYCQWLFPLLFWCETYCEKREDDYQNRYIGFLAEHLMSVYFLYHEKDYKIVHARKHFIE